MSTWEISTQSQTKPDAPSWTLRKYLVVLVIVVLLPASTFGLATTGLLAYQAFRRIEDEAKRLASSAGDDVASYLDLHIAALGFLSQLLPSVKDGNYRSFYEQAQKMKGALGNSISLSDTSGNRILSTDTPFGPPVGEGKDLRGFRRAAKTSLPAVSNLFGGGDASGRKVALEFPIFSEGVVQQVLTLSVEAADLAAEIGRTRIPEGWMLGLVDGNGILISRSIHPEYVGHRVNPLGLAAIDSALAGTFHDVSREGVRLFNVFRRVPGTTWTVLIGVPERLFYAPLYKPLGMLVAAGALLFGLTLLIALRMGRRLSSAADQLSEAALAVGRGEVPPAGQSIVEFRHVSNALQKAAADLREHQAGLVAARNAVAQAADVKARFFAAASHDLRQPMQAVVLLTNALDGYLTDPKARQAFNHLVAAEKSASDLLDNLLEVCRLDAGVMAPGPTEFDMAEAVVAVAEECRPLAQQKGLSLHIRRLETAVRTDRLMLYRILRNLLLNAIRYTESGGILITCRRRSGRLAVEVWDTGIGIPADKLEKVWEEFYQVDMQHRHAVQGLGLGLSIVQRLAKLLNCELSVRSRLGRGTVFAITLPPEAIFGPIGQSVLGEAKA